MSLATGGLGAKELGRISISSISALGLAPLSLSVERDAAQDDMVTVKLGLATRKGRHRNHFYPAARFQFFPGGLRNRIFLFYSIKSKNTKEHIWCYTKWNICGQTF